MLVGQKRRGVGQRSRHEHQVGAPTLRNNHPRKASDKYDMKLGLISAAISAKKFSEEPNPSEQPTTASQRLSVLTKRPAEVDGSAGARSTSHQGNNMSNLSREEARHYGGKRQRTETNDPSKCSSGFTSVSSMAQKFIPQWIQSIQSSLTDTFNQIQENLSLITTYPPQALHQRGTIEPQIPDGQRLVGNGLGFQEADIRATQTKVIDHSNKKLLSLGFQEEDDQEEPEEEDHFSQTLDI